VTLRRAWSAILARCRAIPSPRFGGGEEQPRICERDDKPTDRPAEALSIQRRHPPATVLSKSKDLIRGLDCAPLRIDSKAAKANNRAMRAWNGWYHVNGNTYVALRY